MFAERIKLADTTDAGLRVKCFPPFCKPFTVDGLLLSMVVFVSNKLGIVSLSPAAHTLSPLTRGSGVIILLLLFFVKYFLNF